MPNISRRWWLVLWRILGVAGDLHFGWSMLVQYVLPSAAVAGLATYLAGWGLSFSEYLAGLPFLLRAGFFACLFVLAFGVINRARQRVSDWWAQRGVTPPSATTTYNIENVLIGDQGQENRETTAKRKAANDLLGNALEKGESLKQGRRYAIEGDENQNLEDIEIGNEHQARYEEEVRGWVDHTYDLIDDAFGRTAAQRFISNEGYTDQELFGRKLPSFLHVSSTQRKYSLRARLKRLHELTDRIHNLDINPDFDPEKWRQP
jgi:hypothetical protein